METKEQLTTDFNKRFKRGKYWDITICWNKGDYPLVIGSSVESVKDDIINFTIEQMSLQKQEIVGEMREEIRKWFHRLVEKDDYAQSELDGILEHLYNIS